VLDTALALQLVAASDILLKDVDRLSTVVRRRAIEERDTLMAGRTHGIHAEPVSFGFVLAGWLDELRAGGQGAGEVALLARSRSVLEQRALPLLRRAGMEIAPILVADQARVALGDEIGGAMGAAMVAMLIGERPGLTALDSLGIYLTYGPRRGRTDAERNCISNIRPGGLSPRQGAEKLAWLAGAALQLGETGVTLKDEQPSQAFLPP
jgi:hypothetical protein